MTRWHRSVTVLRMLALRDRYFASLNFDACAIVTCGIPVLSEIQSLPKVKTPGSYQSERNTPFTKDKLDWLKWHLAIGKSRGGI